MKKALSLIFMFFIFLFAGIIISTILYSAYLGILNYVVGLKLPVFEVSTITNAFFYILPLIILLECPVLCYYRVRHVGKLPQIITYIIISLICWVVLFPFTLNLQKQYFSKNDITYQKYDLTSSYFRKLDDRIFYFTDNFDSKKSGTDELNSVVINTTENGEVLTTNLPTSKDFILYREAYPFTDNLIKDSFSTDNLKFLIDYKIILNRGYTAFNKGITFYLGFLTFALALISLFAFSNFFNWRLINAVFIIFSTIIIFFINTFYYNPVFDTFKKQFIYNNNLFAFLGKYVDEPLLCIINITISLILLISGFVNFIVKKSKLKK